MKQATLQAIRRLKQHAFLNVGTRQYDLIEKNGVYNEPLAPEVYCEIFPKSYSLEWFKMSTRSWFLVDLCIYTDQWRLVLMEWEEGDFESAASNAVQWDGLYGHRDTYARYCWREAEGTDRIVGDVRERRKEAKVHGGGA